MAGDILVFNIGGESYGVSTSVVSGIVEAAKVSSIPGQKGFVRGVISMRGEAVAVVDLARALGAETPGPALGQKGLAKVVVIHGDGHTLGLDIGTAKPAFLWEGDYADQPAPGEKKRRYTEGSVSRSGVAIHMVGWRALFEEASRILATEEG